MVYSAEIINMRGSKCLMLITLCLGLVCVLLLVFIILLYIAITAERDLIKVSAEEFNKTINILQNSHTDLKTEKHQLQINFSSLSQKNLETRVNDLTAEKSQLQRDFDSLSQKNLELDSRVRSLSEEESKQSWLFMSTELKSWSDSRQYCRDRGADLVIINTEEKQRFISSLVSERVWIGLSDTENEGNMKWVDNSPLKQGFWLKDQPNNSGGNQNCIELNYDREKPGWSSLNSWNDFSCIEKKMGICEK